MKDKIVLNVGYRGGSGGFLFLHFLLLSEGYYSGIYQGRNISDVIEKQWNISNNLNWKESEVIPNNYSSISGQSNLDKILYYCNPTEEVFFKKQRLTNIFLNQYNREKEYGWPDLKNLEDLVNLDIAAYNIIFNKLDCKNILTYLKFDIPKTKTLWLYTDLNSQNELAFFKKAYFYFKEPNKEKITDFTGLSDTWQNLTVDKDATSFLKNSDIQIKLQDWVNNPKLLVDLGLINKVNQNQIDLLDRWRRLHPPELLQAIGIV